MKQCFSIMYIFKTINLSYNLLMKTIIRKSNERLVTNIDWLKSYHTFSFGEHYDPNWMGFRNLRVINDDYIEPNQGFPFHPHRNMEIITFMLNGKLEHQDSLGNKSIIEPGELQVMSAGRGIIHSEFSKSDNGLVHLLQIWILPKEQNITPRYDQKQILNHSLKNCISLIASDDPKDLEVMAINANAKIWKANLENISTINFTPSHYQNLWIHVFKGSVSVNDQRLEEGDSLGILDVNHELIFKNLDKADFLIFELE